MATASFVSALQLKYDTGDKISEVQVLRNLHIARASDSPCLNRMERQQQWQNRKAGARNEVVAAKVARVQRQGGRDYGQLPSDAGSAGRPYHD